MVSVVLIFYFLDVINCFNFAYRNVNLVLFGVCETEIKVPK